MNCHFLAEISLSVFNAPGIPRIWIENNRNGFHHFCWQARVQCSAAHLENLSVRIQKSMSSPTKTQPAKRGICGKIIINKQSWAHCFRYTISCCGLLILFISLICSTHFGCFSHLHLTYINCGPCRSQHINTKWLTTMHVKHHSFAQGRQDASTNPSP